MKPKIFPSILAFCQDIENEFAQIPTARKEKLLSLSQYFSKKFHSGETPQAIIICTHNSRRSHLGQIWLAVGADYYGLPAIKTFSGGTEATAFNPRAVAALQRVGFDIQADDIGASNPKYQIQWTEEMKAYPAFSKRFEDAPNPTTDFAAIMVCSEADEACPFVSGTDFRLALPFDDPKAFDGTNLESLKYDERCRQIGREMLFVLSELANQ